MPKLYVVATPIGNLSDLSPRALETLQSVSLIAAEDTRVTGNLLRKFGVEKPMISCHRHNEADRLEGIISRMLEENIDVALTTDAGTPAVSDPGDLLVHEAARAGIEVIPIPGCCAVAAALSACGFSSREFAFYGFLPREKGDLRKKLENISRGIPVCVAYESPHRVTDLIAVLAERFADCEVCCCCDLTKLHEKIYRGSDAQVLEQLKANPKAEKGEYCLVFDFSRAQSAQEPQEKPAAPQSAEGYILTRMYEGASPQEAVAELIAQGAKKNEVKRAAIAVKAWISQLTQEEE